MIRNFLICHKNIQKFFRQYRAGKANCSMISASDQGVPRMTIAFHEIGLNLELLRSNLLELAVFLVQNDLTPKLCGRCCRIRKITLPVLYQRSSNLRGLSSRLPVLRFAALQLYFENQTAPTRE